MVNPLASKSSGATASIATSTTHITGFQNASTEVTAVLNSAGLTASKLSEAQILLTGATASITNLVSYGASVVDSLGSRLSAADTYVKSMRRFGTDEGCGPFNSVMNVVSNAGNTVLDGMQSALDTANTAMSSLTDAIDSASSEIASIAAQVSDEIDELTTKINGYISDALQYISDEEEALENYIKTALHSFLAENFPDWFTDTCKSSVVTSVASDDLKSVMNS